MEDVGDLQLEEPEVVDMECVQDQCEEITTMPDKHGRQRVRAALDSEWCGSIVSF